MHPHPKNFLIAHRWFDLPRFSGWGALTDGPTDRADMPGLIDDAFDDAPPTLQTLWVQEFRDDAPPRDVSEDFILAWELANAPDEDELIEQARCDRADDYASMVRQGVAA